MQCTTHEYWLPGTFLNMVSMLHWWWPQRCLTQNILAIIHSMVLVNLYSKCYCVKNIERVSSQRIPWFGLCSQYWSYPYLLHITTGRKVEECFLKQSKEWFLSCKECSSLTQCELRLTWESRIAPINQKQEKTIEGNKITKIFAHVNLYFLI